MTGESTGDRTRTTPASEFDALLAVHYPSAYNCGCGHPINSPEGWAAHVAEVVGERRSAARGWDEGFAAGVKDATLHPYSFTNNGQFGHQFERTIRDHSPLPTNPYRKPDGVTDDGRDFWL